MTHSYTHPRPALAVDCVVFAILKDRLNVLLIQRGEEPFRGQWALPGGFVRVDETAETAARRELLEETNLKQAYLEQLYTFTELERDPRERVVSIAYTALVKPTDVRGGSDADTAAWTSVEKIPKLVFDHGKILSVALERLRAKVRYQPVGFELLPTKFTLGGLQRLYEAILGRSLDPRNFRRTFLKMGILDELSEMETDVAHRPSRLYRFNKAQYQKLLKAGFSFEV